MGEVPSSQVPSYQPKHWHWFLLGAFFVVAVFAGGFIYLSINNSSVQPSQAPSVTISVQSSGLPTQIGQCDSTNVSWLGYRLSGVPTSTAIRSGSAIQYSDGGSQVSYETVSGIENSQIGDPINLCLVSIPTDCPPGDSRGKVYKAINLRTGESWEEADSEHMCGGA